MLSFNEVLSQLREAHNDTCECQQSHEADCPVHEAIIDMEDRLRVEGLVDAAY